jgi:hypothetical protein
MAGKKGRSGRKPLGWYRDLNDLLDRSLQEVMAAFDNPEIPQLEKAKIGQAFLSKKISEKIDLTIEHVLNPVQLSDLKVKIAAMRKGNPPIEYHATDAG